MKFAWAMAYGVGIGLLAGGLLWLINSQPRGTPIQLQPPPTPAPILVHVAGAVHQPGVFALPAGSRVQDAVLAAGGFTSEADSHALNLAAFLQDGGRVFVPNLAAPDASVPGDTRLASPQVIFPLDINLASAAELEALPEIGPETARKIVEYRQIHGAFQTLEEIMDVPDIGPLTFAAIQELITIGTIP